MNFTFGTNSTPSRYQGGGTPAPSLFDFQPTMEINAMYLADPSAPSQPTVFAPHSSLMSFEEAIQQNPNIKKFSPHEVSVGEVIGAGILSSELP
jgi:hypothetical protein